jgi:hypothetical protein
VRLPLRSSTAWARTTPQRAAAAALAVLSAAAATVLVVSADRDTVPGEVRTPAQVAALARLEPYVELLADDFDAAVVLLPDGLVRDLAVSSDGLSGTGRIALPIQDGGCAAIRVEIGPAYLLEGDPAGLEVSGPVLLDDEQCP